MARIKVKYGDCSECEAKDVPLARVRPPECPRCYKYKKTALYLKRAKEKEEREREEQGGEGKTSSLPVKAKKRSFISPVSDKRAARLKVYRKKRDKYLEANKVCEVRDCNRPSNNLHHKAGREGSLLDDERYFMACCGLCHPSRIHENPNWAEENGYTLRIRPKF